MCRILSKSGAVNRSLTTVSEPSSMSHEDFMRRFLQSERELQRYVMSFVPNANDARDIVQNTAIALWKKIDKYDPAEPFSPWAFRFAVFEVKEFLRKEARWRRFLDDEVIELLAFRQHEMSKELDERRIHLRECLRKLPDKQKTLIEGYYFNDHSIEGVAELSGRTVDAVYKALQRIRGALMGCVNRRMEVSR